MIYKHLFYQSKAMLEEPSKSNVAASDIFLRIFHSFETQR